MKKWIAICLVAVAAVFSTETKVADAAAANQNYITFVQSTVSGDFTAVLSFDAATFLLVAENGELGGGTFVDVGPFTIGTGVGDGYIGSFFALSSPALILGVGAGSVGDTFWFIGGF